MTVVPIGPRPRGRVPSLVSVVIPARNSAATLRDQIDALRRQDPSPPWELLLADNGSTDGTVALFGAATGGDDRAAGPTPWVRARVVDASARTGSAHARNVGAEEADGDLYCFCDADDVVDRVWLAELVRVAADHHLVGGRLETERLNSAKVRGWRAAPSTSAGSSPTFAPTGNLAIWADCFDALGGLDEGYLKSHDVELSARALAAGASLGFAPDAVVHYRFRSTLRGLARQSYRGGRATVQMGETHPGRDAPLGARDAVQRIGWSVARAPYLVVAARRGLWVRRTAEAAGITVALARRAVGRRRTTTRPADRSVDR